VIVNVPVVLPPSIVTVPCTFAEPELLVTVTLNPPVGAGELRVIVPVLDFPPVTEEGANDNNFTPGLLIVRFADSVDPLRFAVIAATVC